MKILALEFSSGQQSVAVLATGSGLLPPSVLSEERETGCRTTKALALIERALHQAGCSREEIECLAVGLGPGSYMGIRVAIALAQGWQLARGVKILGLGSLPGVAAQARHEGCRGRVHVAIDAQRDEAYLASYDLTGTAATEVAPLRLAPAAEIRALAAAGELIVGPEVERWTRAGRVVFPGARQLGLLSLDRTDFVAGEALEPIYLRPVSFVKAPQARVLAPASS